ncbi:MAG: metallophosphoesterase [Planctomycetota bacterium]|jgi:predicted MPP superfamily phosphohydrolase
MSVTRRRFLWMAGAGLVTGTAYAYRLEPVWLRTEALDLALPRLDPAFDGYRIVQLSDLHVGPAVPERHLRRAVELANSLQPDLIVVTGDLVDRAAHASAPETAASILSMAKAPDGVLATLGNHDLGVYHPDVRADETAVGRIDGALHEAGVRLLCNATETIERGRARLRVAGLGDLWSGHFDPERIAKRRPTGCTVALSHSPDTAPELARRGFDLVLSGHTHGGQVYLPLLGPPYIPLRHKQYLAGHFRLGETQLYVNSGLGWSRRIRFGSRPEVTLLRLHCV